jgi:hypothetical protein
MILPGFSLLSIPVWSDKSFRESFPPDPIMPFTVQQFEKDEVDQCLPPSRSKLVEKASVTTKLFLELFDMVFIQLPDRRPSHCPVVPSRCQQEEIRSSVTVLDVVFKTLLDMDNQFLSLDMVGESK